MAEFNIIDHLIDSLDRERMARIKAECERPAHEPQFCIHIYPPPMRGSGYKEYWEALVLGPDKKVIRFRRADARETLDEALINLAERTKLEVAR